MSFQLKSFRAFENPTSGVTTKRGLQCVELVIGRTSGDTLIDLDAATAGALGTFWTAVCADATYGAIATATWLPAWRQIMASIEAVVDVAGVGSAALLLQAATAGSANQFAVANQGAYPVVSPRVTLNGDTNTEIKLFFTFLNVDKAYCLSVGQ